MNEGVSASFLKIGEVNALGGDKRLAISIPLSIEMAQVVSKTCTLPLTPPRRTLAPSCRP